MDKEKEFNAMREAICAKANTKICLNDKCPKLYRCPLGEPTIEGLEILVDKGFGNIKQLATDIITSLFGYIGSNQKFCIVDNEKLTFINVDELFDFIGKLAEKYNVEYRK